MTRAVILLGAASVALFCSPAFGADTYSASSATGSYKGTSMPFVSWNGMYLGVNGGGAWGSSKELVFVDGDPTITANVGGFRPSGGFGGGQIGYNWQGAWSPGLVLGIEADIQAGGIYDHFSRTVSYFHPTTFDGKLEMNYFGTARARIGFATGSALIYGTGGFAFGGAGTHFGITSTTFTNDNVGGSTAGVGFCGGGGIEYRLTPQWSARAEYQYLALEHQRLHGVASDRVIDTSSEIKTGLNTVRLGINFFVNPTYRPLN
jgi:outer membrane immunogenic protein